MKKFPAKILEIRRSIQNSKLTCHLILFFSNFQDFKVDTFEYRLLREVSFRESLTRRYVGESDMTLSTTVERQLGPPAPPQLVAKPRNSKLQEGSDAVFVAQVPANPRPRVSTRVEIWEPWEILS